MRTSVRCSLLLTGLIALACTSPPAQAQAVTDFHLPSQALADSIKAVGSQTNTNILFNPKLVAGRKAPALQGGLTASEALSRLLAGTGIRYEFLNESTVVLAKQDPADGKPLSAAPAAAADSPPIPEAKEGKTASSTRFLVAQAAQTQAPAAAPTIPSAGTAPAGSELAEVIVTGTRRQDRTVAQSSAPIDVLSGGDLAAQSSTNMLDTLSNMVPSFIVGQNSISDASSFVRAPSLRGLPGDEMLVMLNGKRLNRSALVQVFEGGETALSFGSQGPDLASIPSIAIKSLEILRDGATAQYGSDAIAGVLNYHFRDNPHGIELLGHYGEYFPGNGFPNDGDDRQLAANIGLPLGSQGFANFSAEWDRSDQTVRNVTREAALAFAQTFPSLAADLPHYPGPVQQWGTPPSQSEKFVLNAGIRLDNGDQVYFLANYANIETNESFNYRLSKTVTDMFGNTFSANPIFNDIYLDPCPSNYTGCPSGGYIQDSHVFNFSSIYPAGFTPRFYGTTQESWGTLGYKGAKDNGLTYDVSGTIAQNSLGVGLKYTMNPSMGPLSPTSFYDGKFVQKETTFNIDLSYPWEIPWIASPLTVAGGLDWHEENYLQLQGDAASFASGPYAQQPLYDCSGTACAPALDSSGTQIIASQFTESNGYGGISANIDASQINYGGYLDLEADLIHNLTLGIAGRWEDYSSFGTTTVGKISARYKVTRWLALRSTASTGFHAPTPGQSNVETVTTTFIPGTATPVQIGTYPVTSDIARFFGAQPLRPESSTNISAGIVLTPGGGLLVTIDGYDIKVRHRIGISQQFNVTQADVSAVPALAAVGAGGTVQYFTNGFDTRTRGVDVVANDVLLVGPGRLNATLAYNYNKSDVTSHDPTVISQAQIVNVQHYAPNSRANLNLDYSFWKVTASLHENYYGTFRDEVDYPGQVFSAKETTDLAIGYEFMRGITATLGARNLFDEYPDRIANSPTNEVFPNGGLVDGEVYPRTGGPFGYNGRFLYLQLDAKL